MSLIKYQSGSVPTILKDFNIEYYCLGLSGETGEIMNHYLKNSSSHLIIKEIGDVLWYLARITEKIDTTLDKLQIQSFGSSFGELCIFLGSCVGEVNDSVKKFIRDDNRIINKTRREYIIKNCGQILSILSEMAVLQNATILDVANMNIKKIMSRQQRQVIHGSGDNR